MSLTNILLIVIAIGVSVAALKIENAVKLLSQIAVNLQRPAEQSRASNSSMDAHFDEIHRLLSKIESHTDLLTEPVKEARMKEIIDAMPGQS